MLINNNQFGHMNLQWFAEDDGQNGGGESDSGAGNEPAGQPDDYKVRYDKLAEEVELIKKAQSGVDKDNKRLRDENTAINEKLQQEEEGKKTAEQRSQERIDKLERENAEQKTEQMRTDKLAKADLISVNELLKLDTTSEDGMDSFIDSYKTSVETEVKRHVEAEIATRFGNSKPPEGGESEKTTYTSAEWGALSDEEVAKIDVSKIKVI